MNNDDFWDRRKTLAAQLVAEDELTNDEIAQRCRRTARWLTELKHDDRFMARVRFLIEQLRAAIADRGIVERRNRVDQLNARADELRDRKRLLTRVIEERAEFAQKLLAERREAWDSLPVEEQEKRRRPVLEVPGATTGMLVKGVKGVANMPVETWEVDAALLGELRGLDAELRAIEKQAAQELGQWSEKRELTGKGGGPVVLIREVYEHGPGHVSLG